MKIEGRQKTETLEASALKTLSTGCGMNSLYIKHHMGGEKAV